MKKFLSVILVVLLIIPAIASCSGVDFKLTFIVDGEKYSTISTNGKEAITMPQDPQKDGYIFDGWYWDEGTWQEPFTANSLLDAPLSSNMNIYARFIDQNDVSDDLHNEDNATSFIQSEEGENVPYYADLSQKVVKNENFLDSEVSWYDDDYNYYVFHVGKIKNIPLTSTYTIFTYAGGNPTYTRSVMKATEQSIKTSTSIAITRSFTTSDSKTLSLSSELTAGEKNVLSANIKSGYTSVVTNTNTTTNMWSESYEICVKNSSQITDTITIPFNSSWKQGNYLYLCLGSVNVYYAVIQSRTNPEEYYVEMYDSIYNTQYALVYCGSNDELDSSSGKIDVDSSFVANLKAPTKYIQGEKPELTFEPVIQVATKEESVTVENGAVHWWWVEIDDYDKYHAQGYNKIKIEYEFQTTGGWSLFGGNVDINGFISSTDSSEKSVHHFEEPSSKDGKKISGSVITELEWFEKSKKVYLITENENLTESFTVSRLKFKITIYKED